MKTNKMPPLSPKDRINFIARWPGMLPLDSKAVYVPKADVLATIAARYGVAQEKLICVPMTSSGDYGVFQDSTRQIAYVVPSRV